MPPPPSLALRHLPHRVRRHPWALDVRWFIGEPGSVIFVVRRKTRSRHFGGPSENSFPSFGWPVGEPGPVMLMARRRTRSRRFGGPLENPVRSTRHRSPLPRGGETERSEERGQRWTRECRRGFCGTSHQSYPNPLRVHRILPCRRARVSRGAHSCFTRPSYSSISSTSRRSRISRMFRSDSR